MLCNCVIANGPNKGKQCSNKAKPGTPYCGVHKNCKNPTGSSPAAAAAAAAKPVAKVKSPQPAAAPMPKADNIDLEVIKADAQHMFPGDKQRQEDYVNDIISLYFPQVPTDDKVARYARQKMEQRANMVNRCQRCLKALRARKLLKAHDWFTAASLCQECHQKIAELYHDPGFTETYKKYHKGKIPTMEQLLENGQTNDYYNNTMYTGAKFWADAAARRGAAALPKVPRK